MTEEALNQPEEPARGGGWKLLAASGLVSLMLGGGAYYAVSSGVLPLRALWAQVVGGRPTGRTDAAPAGAAQTGATGESASRPGTYVHLDPLTLSLGPQSAARHLRVSLVIEVAPGREDEVAAVRPRLVDVFNVFLRAVDEREFELPQSMERLRAQMLRRAQLVSPDGAVRDILIQEFVIN